jgi:hypothetical protein
MSDAWELLRGLDPNDPVDRNALDLDPDYTNLEVYLAELADSAPARPVPSFAGVWSRALLFAAFCAVAFATSGGRLGVVSR